MIFIAKSWYRFSVVFLGLLIFLYLVFQFGSAQHDIYRKNYDLCSKANPEVECKNNALQQYTNSSDPDSEYLLGFIEFDDQGQLFDRQQMSGVVDQLNIEAATQDLLIIVFVHGWKHSAAPGDDNIKTFRNRLKRLSSLESEISSSTDELVPKRKVVGVYLGWRGGSITVPGLEELTFWDRKNTAHKVGNGGIIEVLSRIEQVQKTKNTISQKSRTRLVIIGHSFGGAVVYSALSKRLENGLVRATNGSAGVIDDAAVGYGDLVVLINPAFEAIQFSPMSDISTELYTYSDSQLPLLAVLTSEADKATKYAFPFGRWFSTLFENERTVTRKNGVTGMEDKIDQSSANITAVGHFEPYKTHKLTAMGPPKTSQNDFDVQSAAQRHFTISQQWETDKPGSKIAFEGAELKRNGDSAGRNPYLVIQVDEKLIPDHNNISDPRIESFIRQLVLISSQDRKLDERQKYRGKALAANRGKKANRRR